MWVEKHFRNGEKLDWYLEESGELRLKGRLGPCYREC